MKKSLLELWHLDTKATEFWLCLISLASGIWLLVPFETISVPFRAFPASGPVSLENGTGLWLLFLGGLRLHSVVTNHRERRAACAALSFFTWIFLLYLSLLVDYRALVTVMYFVPSLMSLWVFFKSPLRLRDVWKSKTPFNPSNNTSSLNPPSFDSPPAFPFP